MEYQLMNKNTVVALFSTAKQAVLAGTPKTVIAHIQVVNANMYEFAVGRMALQEFLDLRKTPMKRKTLIDMFKYLNFDDIDTYLNITRALSLIDTFWVRVAGDGITWADVNLYENNFNEVIAHYAFEGTGILGMKFRTSSPEFSTDGILDKMWRRMNGDVLLYKTGTTGTRNAGFEPYAEYYASEIAKRMNLYPYVQYGLQMYHNRLCSTCPIFTSPETSYISMARYLCSRGDKSGDSWECTIAALGLAEQWKDMVLYDSVICNTDRHLGNFGVVMSTDTGHIERLSVIFDNGQSLGVYWMPDHTERMWEEANDSHARHALYPSNTFEELGRSVLDKRRAAALRRLLGWRVPKHPLYNYMEEKYEEMNALIQHQVKGILQ